MMPFQSSDCKSIYFSLIFLVHLSLSHMLNVLGVLKTNTALFDIKENINTGFDENSTVKIIIYKKLLLL